MSENPTKVLEFLPAILRDATHTALARRRRHRGCAKADASTSDRMSKPGDHTIVEATEPLPAQKDQEDGPLYVHFLPRKEYLAAGTPWIVHSRYGCHPVAHVQFESVLGMTTGEGQPPVKVCLCGVSNHHLQVRRASFPECHGTRFLRVSRGCALTRPLPRTPPPPLPAAQVIGVCRLIKREIDGKRRPVCVVSSNGDASAPNLVNSLAAREEAEDARCLLAESRAETRKLRADADAARKHHGHLRARLEDARRASRRAEEDAARLAAELDAERAKKKRLSDACGASASRARDARGTQKYASRAREELEELREELRGAHARSARDVARVEAENRRLVAKLANLRARATATKETKTEAEAFGGRQGVTPRWSSGRGTAPGVTETAARRRATPSEVAAALLAAETEPSSTREDARAFVGVRPGSGGSAGSSSGSPADSAEDFPASPQARVAAARKARANTPVFGGGFARRKVPPRRTHVVALVSPAFGDP